VFSVGFVNDRADGLDALARELEVLCRMCSL
jgi:hypothetical protein